MAGWVAMLPLTRPPRTTPASTRGRTGGDGRARPHHGIKARCRPRAAASPRLGGGALGREVARTNARPLVLVQLVATGAGAHGPCAAVAAAVGAAAVVRLAAVHYLHLNPCGETRHQGRGTGAGVTPRAGVALPAPAAATLLGNRQHRAPGPGGPWNPLSSWGLPSSSHPPGAHTQPPSPALPLIDKESLPLGQSELAAVVGWDWGAVLPHRPLHAPWCYCPLSTHGSTAGRRHPARSLRCTHT